MYACPVYIRPGVDSFDTLVLPHAKRRMLRCRIVTQFPLRHLSSGVESESPKRHPPQVLTKEQTQMEILTFKTDSSFTGEWEVQADYFAAESEHIILRGLPESTEGTVHARIGPIGWFEFTGV